MDQDDLIIDAPEEHSRFGMSVVLIVALILMTAAFVWFVIQLDPLTSDFIEPDTVNATPTEETGEP